MAEYIEREKIGLTDFEIAMCNGDYKEGMKMFLDKIASIPAADVRPVVRGKWIWFGDCSNEGLYCSVCKNKIHEVRKPKKKLSNFCPNCGADMMEES